MSGSNEPGDVDGSADGPCGRRDFPMKKSVWYLVATVVGLTAAFAATKALLRLMRPRVLAFGVKDHANRNFDSFPIDIPEKEFEDWLS